MDQDKRFTMRGKAQKTRMGKVYSEILASSQVTLDLECDSGPSTSGVDLNSQLSVSWKELVNSYRICTAH